MARARRKRPAALEPATDPINYAMAMEQGYSPAKRQQLTTPQTNAGFRIKTADGKLINPDDPDELAIPHVYTFGSIIQGASYTYMHGRHDEAMKHSRENAIGMRRDPFIMALLNERKRDVLRQKWHIEPD